MCLLMRMLSQFLASSLFRTLLLSQFSLYILELAPLPNSQTRWNLVLDFSGLLIKLINLSMCYLSGNSGMLLKNTFSRNFGILVPLCFFRSMGFEISLGMMLIQFYSRSAGSKHYYYMSSGFLSDVFFCSCQLKLFQLFSIIFQLYYCFLRISHINLIKRNANTNLNLLTMPRKDVKKNQISLHYYEISYILQVYQMNLNEQTGRNTRYIGYRVREQEKVRQFCIQFIVKSQLFLLGLFV